MGYDDARGGAQGENMGNVGPKRQPPGLAGEVRRRYAPGTLWFSSAMTFRFAHGGTQVIRHVERPCRSSSSRRQGAGAGEATGPRRRGSRPTRAHRLAAFTLIELLVVVAIIAVLLAILLPSLTAAKRLARQVMCATNVHGYVLASLMYATEYNDDLPLRGPEGSAFMATNIVGTTFRTRLAQYWLEAPSAFCPEAGRTKEVEEFLYTANGGELGYAYYGAPLNGTGQTRPAKAHQATDETGRPFFLYADVNRFFATGEPLHNNHPDPAAPTTSWITVWGFPLYTARPRGLNSGYLDGHVEWNAYSAFDLTIYYQTSWGDISYHWTR